jgi:hypothetical protein
MFQILWHSELNELSFSLAIKCTLCYLLMVLQCKKGDAENIFVTNYHLFYYYLFIIYYSSECINFVIDMFT